MRTRQTTKKRLILCGIIASAMVLMIALLIGCQGTAGTGGASTGTLTGKITNSLTSTPVSGAKVTTDPVIQGVTITSDASGSFSATLPIGVYTLNISKENFTAAKETASLVSGQTVTKNIVLKPAKSVAVNPGAVQTAAAGATVTLKAMVEPLDGSGVTAYSWAQVNGVPAKLSNEKTDTATAVLGKAADYKAALIKGLKQEDRFEVQAINPESLIWAEKATFKVTVTTSSGSYAATVDVNVGMPFEFTTGLQNVPQGVPVLLHGKKQSSYGWTIAGPAGSKAEFDEPTAQNPAFTPDMVGKYVVTEKTSGATVNVFAGTWAGAISGIDAKGLPLAAACTTCHNGSVASDNFTAWRQSGHAEIFTQNINDPNGHWAINCAECHSVGYSPKVTNGGFDEAVAAENWKVPSRGEVGYYKMMLEKFPKTARLANIQCENCHGPNNASTLHSNGTVDAARVSISSNACGSCHGEPPRHGRFQQWEKSGHGNYEPAILEATVENRGATAGHCGRCHSGQGFLTWTQQKDLTMLIQGKSGNATVDELKAMGLTKDTVHPITCATCHDPHAVGTTSGEPNTATVRITGNTSVLPAGFKAEKVGKGAICMTCHNTRNGLHNDALPLANYSAPHVAAQTDVIMGQNAYLVGIDQRSSHASIKDTCVNCHMGASPPPAEFSFQLSGTNHAFKASIDICKTCHNAALDGAAFQISYEARLHELGNKMSKYFLNKLPANITIIDYTPHSSGGKNYDIKSNPINVNKSDIASVEPLEPHGQQGFLVKFKGSVTFTYKPQNADAHTFSQSEAQVQLGDFTTDGTNKVIPLTDPLVKVGWNYFLIHGDNSKGIHNPKFISEVLEASLTALK